VDAAPVLLREDRSPACRDGPSSRPANGPFREGQGRYATSPPKSKSSLVYPQGLGLRARVYSVRQTDHNELHQLTKIGKQGLCLLLAAEREFSQRKGTSPGWRPEVPPEWILSDRASVSSASGNLPFRYNATPRVLM
jgi:hypothetical protein